MKRTIRNWLPSEFLEYLKIAKDLLLRTRTLRSTLEFLVGRKLLEYRRAPHKRIPRSFSRTVVCDAKRHWKAVKDVPLPVPVDPRWDSYISQMASAIEGFVDADHAIFYAQSRVGFDHRVRAAGKTSLFPIHERTLKSEFPAFTDAIETMGESAFSRRSSLRLNRGRLVSNIFFWHLRYVLQCLSRIPQPEVIAEIGGGYGGPARLWLTNPIHEPRTYILIDFPESLFFSENFLRVNFPEWPILYVTSPERIQNLSAYRIVLCPIAYLDTLREVPLDLVINTGSMQEMTDAAVDFWMDWLDHQPCRYFYSLNLFGGEAATVGVTWNRWAPRLSARWTVRYQRYDPPFLLQQGGCHFAEIVAERTPQEHRMLDGQLLLEFFDQIRRKPDPSQIEEVLQRCTTELPLLPKEASYLKDYLGKLKKS